MSRTYQEVAQEVDLIADGLNMPVDQGIKKLVIALRINDFPTDGSCEGHLDKGLPYPWVDIYAPEQEEKAWLKANNFERERLTLLLDKFYTASALHPKFTYENIGIFGGFRLVCSTNTFDEEVTSLQLVSYRNNFDALADFLLKGLR